MAIQMRNGAYEDFSPDRLVVAELAVVTEGDPDSRSGRALYICFEPGVVKRICDYEDILDLFEDAEEEAIEAAVAAAVAALQSQISSTVTHVEDIQTDVTAKASTATTKAAEAATSASTATTKASEASSSASTATSKASEAATSASTATTKATDAANSATAAAASAAQIGDYCLWFKDQSVSATTGDILTISNAKITADHIVSECVWGDPSAITSDVTWTTSAGSLVLNGTCTTATTATILLIRKTN